mgnify:CR=1 FL=1
MTHATAFTPAEIGGLARRIDRPVVLVGLMGVGKSTVGRRLAALLDTDFIDVDSVASAPGYFSKAKRGILVTT